MNSMIGNKGMQGPTGMSAGRNASGFNQMNKMQAPSGYESFNQFTPEQMKLFQGLFKNIGNKSFLSQIAGGNEDVFQQMEEPAMRQFQDLMSQNASQFSGMGMGARHGSGFNNTQSQATSNFAQDLQSKRMDYMRNALSDLMGYSHQLLGEQPYGFQEKKPALGGYGGLLGGLLGAGAGGFFGGPAGALAGGTFGQKLLSGV